MYLCSLAHNLLSDNGLLQLQGLSNCIFSHSQFLIMDPRWFCQYIGYSASEETGFDVRQRHRYFITCSVQTSLEAHSSAPINVYQGSFPMVKYPARKVDHSPLVPSLRMSGPIFLLPLLTYVVYTGTTYFMHDILKCKTTRPQKPCSNTRYMPFHALEFWYHKH